MAYLGIALALFFLYEGFKVALTQHEVETSDLSTILLVQLCSGLIFGFALILACVGPFILLGASWPAMPFLIAILVASIIVIVLYYGKPATRSGNVVVL